MTRNQLLGLPEDDIPLDKLGRPTKYTAAANYEAYSLALLGYTDEQSAKVLGVHESTFHEWKEKYPSFRESIRQGKDVADARVVDSLYKSAMGFEHTSEEIKVIDGQIVRVPIIQKYPPNSAAMIFWLKNRQRLTKNWRDKIETGFTDADGNDVSAVHIFKLPDNDRNEAATESHSGGTTEGISTENPGVKS